MDPTALTAMVDRVIGDRYRVDHLIGAGAISAVFVAVDQLEDRRVALKVFHPALAADEGFIERLLDAVEHAASLVHPNIAQIYDWGVDGGAYIVSELCEGGSLASLLAQGHTLLPSQALVVGLECARALNHGHEQGLMHLNLNPRNVLFTDDQRVRICDYGLTMVLVNATMDHAGLAVDNVRYLSPEQAQGRTADESSDLYSLALVLSAAVSGTPPRVADTPAGTLRERAESAAALHPALGALLTPLERAGRLDPDERPEAEELAIALLAAAETMPRPEAMPLVGIGHIDQADDDEPSEDEPSEDEPSDDEPSDEPDGGQLADERAVVTGPAGEVSDEARDDPDAFDLSALGSLDDLEAFADDEGDDAGHPDQRVDVPGLGGPENLDDAAPTFADVPGSAVTGELDVPEPVATRRIAALAYEEQADDADDRLPWWPLVALLLLIAAAVAAGLYFFALSDAAETAVVPDLIGEQYDDVAAVVDGRGWDIERLETRIDDTVPGSVVAQSPEPGEALDRGGALRVTVSLGNEMVEIPSDIVGLTVEQAASRLGTVGLTVGGLTEQNNEALPAGLVVGLDEPTRQLPRGETVDLLISTGPEDRVVPDDVIGMRIGDATSLLVGLRLQAVEEPEYSADIAAGTVLDSIPAPGQIVPADSAVTLFVSAGPEPVEMPDIVGLQLDEAIDVIEELGLIFVDTTGTPGEAVIGSLPPIGAIADVGTEVTIILDDPPDDEEADE